MIVYNPLGRGAYHAVVVPITTNDVTVYDSKGETVPGQVSQINLDWMAYLATYMQQCSSYCSIYV